MSKPVFSVLVNDIDDVAEWYTRMKDCEVLEIGYSFVTIEHETKIVNYVEVFGEQDVSVWDEIAVGLEEEKEKELLEEEIFCSDTTVEEFFTRDDNE